MDRSAIAVSLIFSGLLAAVIVRQDALCADEQGKERQTLKAGEVYKEPIGTPMQARNRNGSEPRKLLITQVTREQTPDGQDRSTSTWTWSDDNLVFCGIGGNGRGLGGGNQCL